MDNLSVSGNESFRPLPEPDPPDFNHLPDGAHETFEHRLDRLPIRRVHTSIGAEAIMTNESRALHAYEREHGLPWDQFAPLGTWHMRAVHDRISGARPDLLAPRRPSGLYFGLTTMTWTQRMRHRLPTWMGNCLSGTYTWIRNRSIGARAASLRCARLR